MREQRGDPFFDQVVTDTQADAAKSNTHWPIAASFSEAL